MINLVINGKKISAECGKKLSAYLRIDSPCGGNGKCGKCKVKASGALSPVCDAEKSLLSPEEIASGIRLACKTLILGDAEVLTLEKGENRIATDGETVQFKLNPIIKKYGLAVDIGTTTVVVGLYSAKGELLGKQGALNPQTAWGADVISRIEASLSGNGANLQCSIVQLIESTALTLCKNCGVKISEIDGAVITGNTAMLHLLTQTAVDGLARMPFSLKRTFGESVFASDLGAKLLLPETKIYLPPCISPFIGADTVCALLTTQFWAKTDNFLLVDIGTNGEMAFFNGGKIHACSTAAGPAFEGAGLSCGMRGENGAIEHVSVQNGKLVFSVIGDETPKGICGSGVIDAVASLLQTETLDESGYMENDQVLCNGVKFTCKDVRAVQLAKAAIYAGIKTLLNDVGVSVEGVKNFFIAGGFGGYVNLTNAGKIRLFPNELLPRAKTLGNAAFSGAAALLLDKSLQERCAQVIEITQVIDLSKNSVFLQEYTDGMTF